MGFIKWFNTGCFVILKSMRIIITEFMSLDGVMEDPGGSEVSANGAWQIPYMTDDAGAFKFDELKATDGILLGRVTYQGFAATWPGREAEFGEFGELMNSLPKYVVSASLAQEDLTWQNSTVINQDIVDRVAELRAQEGRDLLVAGSDQLVSLLVKSDLVDEYRIMVHPIVLGSGKQLFEGAPQTKLQLTGTRTFTSGIALLTYQPTKEKS
jgi:dihydrofolate reductase